MYIIFSEGYRNNKGALSKIAVEKMVLAEY